MASERTSARALVVLDLLGLAACIAMLVGAASMSRATDVQLLPDHACPAVVAMDLFKAQRLAATSESPVQVQFDRNATGATTGYRIIGPAVRMSAYGLPTEREFRGPAQVSRDAITFLTNGKTDGDLKLELPADDGSATVLVEACGVVRLLAE